MTAVPGWVLPAAQLRFDPAVRRVGTHAFRALRQHGPYDNSELALTDGALLFVFPSGEQDMARRLADALLNGIGTYPGFGELFRVDVAKGNAIKSLRVETDVRDMAAAGRAYRQAIAQRDTDREPDVAIVLVPHTERVETQTPYYEAKAAFANLAVPTQMVTTELLHDEREFQWSVANIALAIFAKLGGVPWAVEAPTDDDDLVIGIGRADVGRDRTRHFGYAVSFVSNGIYRQTWSFTPTADDAVYEQRLQATITEALAADLDQPPGRLVIHLARQTGRREIDAAERAMQAAGLRVPVAFLRLDDSSLHDIADTDEDTFAPAKGLVAKLGPRRALLQSEGLGALGPSEGPLLVTMDRRSSVPETAFDGLIGQVFRLAHANWRGFNAQTKPATLVYGEQLASLVGHLEDVETWNPDLLRSDLRGRPWFL
jgi:hypothetical protein